MRPARVADSGAIAELMGAHDGAHGYEPWITEADVSEDLRDPDLYLDTDTWVVEDGDRLVGYGELWNALLEEARALEAWCWTAPTHLDRGIVSTLLDRTEEAATLAAGSLARRPLLLRNFIWANDDAARALLEARGYGLVRHFFHMAIELAGVGDPPPVPEGLELRSLDPDRDVHALFDLIVAAFQDSWNWSAMTFETFRRRIAERDDFDPSLSPLLFSNDELVGASFNGTKIGQGWADDLAVRADMRGRGIGELLLRHTFARFKDKGWTKVSLGVDSGNPTGAVRLYERVGMHVTRQFDAYEKVIAT